MTHQIKKDELLQIKKKQARTIFVLITGLLSFYCWRNKFFIIKNQRLMMKNIKIKNRPVNL